MVDELPHPSDNAGERRKLEYWATEMHQIGDLLASMAIAWEKQHGAPAAGQVTRLNAWERIARLVRDHLNEEARNHL